MGPGIHHRQGQARAHEVVPAEVFAGKLAAALRYGGIGRLSGILRRRGFRTDSPALIERGRQLERLRYSDRIVVEAGAGDTFVSFMGEWDDPGYIDAVLSADARGSVIVQVSYDLLPIVTPQVSGHSTKPMINYLSQVLPVTDLVLAISAAQMLF